MDNNIYIIKLWSNVLLWKDWIDLEVIENITKSINFLLLKNIKVVIVSSWAVALWKTKLWIKKFSWLDILEAEQVFSSIWQVELINTYQTYFNKYNLKVSQALLTRKDFADRSSYNSMKKVLLSSLKKWIIPIINENDVLSQEELDFSDNDELALLLWAMLWVEKLIILSNINWLLDNFPNWNIIKKISKIDEKIKKMVCINKSSSWKWWMDSKLKIWQQSLDLSIEMYLANWKNKEVIIDIYNWKNPWTLFKAINKKKVNSIRKWLKAWAVPKWKIYISTIISDLLKSWKRASLLDIWIEKIEKHFQKWDVVEVVDEKNNLIWYWISKIKSDFNLNNKKSIIVIHTDYFININN